jgi:hypothetical protein
MRIGIGTVSACLLATALGGSAIPASAQQRAPAPSSAWTAVDQALGRTGAMLPGDVMKYSFPRSDLHVTVDGVQLRPALALGSWVAFRKVAGGKVMAMGDLVLGENEVAPVMRALQQGGVEQTALHNHLLHESPRVMYMHILAHGDAATVAKTIRTALGTTATPLGAPPAPAPAASIDLDTTSIARALGVSGKVNGGVLQFGVPRRETIREGAMEIPSAMGVATSINFQPTGSGRAAVTGDFVMRAGEVNRVIRALQQGGITVTALHSHMLTENPRLFFMHYWGNADAVGLARTLRAALDETQSKLAAR